MHFRQDEGQDAIKSLTSMRKYLMCCVYVTLAMILLATTAITVLLYS